YFVAAAPASACSSAASRSSYIAASMVAPTKTSAMLEPVRRRPVRRRASQSRRSSAKGSAEGIGAGADASACAGCSTRLSSATGATPVPGLLPKNNSPTSALSHSRAVRDRSGTGAADAGPPSPPGTSKTGPEVFAGVSVSAGFFLKKLNMQGRPGRRGSAALRQWDGPASRGGSPDDGSLYSRAQAL